VNCFATCSVLQVEYDQLQQAHGNCYSPFASLGCAAIDGDPSAQDFDIDSTREAEMMVEAKLLRQHKGRLEARMRILEEHNQQLEWQLYRLRQLVENVSGYFITPRCFITCINCRNRLYVCATSI
jgi:hypothetical protein